MDKKRLLNHLRRVCGRISTKEFIKKYCIAFPGNKTRNGIHRTVYQLKANKNYVVKIQATPAFENQIENHIWYEIRKAKSYKKWFAEVLWMNDKGTILVMEKIDVYYFSNTNKKLPKRIPHFLGDVHDGNYGWDKKGQFKCCDYGNTIFTLGWSLKKFKYPEWRIFGNKRNNI